MTPRVAVTNLNGYSFTVLEEEGGGIGSRLPLSTKILLQIIVRNVDAGACLPRTWARGGRRRRCVLKWTGLVTCRVEGVKAALEANGWRKATVRVAAGRLGGSVDKGRQTNGQDDAAELSPRALHRGAAMSERDGLQSRESSAATGAPEGDRGLVAGQFAAQPSPPREPRQGKKPSEGMAETESGLRNRLK